jgi:hypothetical protein
MKIAGMLRGPGRSHRVLACGKSNSTEKRMYRLMVELGRTDLACSTLDSISSDSEARNESTAAGIDVLVLYIGTMLHKTSKTS